MLIKKIIKDEKIVIAKVYTKYWCVLNMIISNFYRIIIIVLKVDIDMAAEIWIIITVRTRSLVITFVINEISPNFFREEILYFKLRIGSVFSRFLNVDLSIALRNNACVGMSWHAWQWEACMAVEGMHGSKRHA
jgi:hypothetical protein